MVMGWYDDVCKEIEECQEKRMKTFIDPYFLDKKDNPSREEAWQILSDVKAFRDKYPFIDKWERASKIICNGGSGVFDKDNEVWYTPLTDLKIDAMIVDLQKGAEDNMVWFNRLPANIKDAFHNAVEDSIPASQLKFMEEAEYYKQQACDEAYIEREPKEFRHSYDKLHNVQKKSRSKSNRKKKRRRK